MKIILIGIMLLWPAMVCATSVAKKPLREIVAESDYIVVGTILRRAMFDSNGREIKDPNAMTGPGSQNETRLYVHIDPSGYLKSPEKKLPEQIVITRFKAHIAYLGSNTESEGSPRIFLLRASPLEETYPRDSIQDIVERPEIEKLVKETQKKPK